MSDEVRAAKAAIREEARAARAALQETERVAASRTIAHTVLGLFDLEGASTVAGYIAVADEVDPYEAVDALRFRGLRVVMPRIEEPVQLALHVVDAESRLVTGPFGILEPEASAPSVPPEHVDCVLVPGVAYGQDGHRIGYGGGFYDRLLKELRGDVVTIGLAFDEQVYPELPALDHDEMVDLVVTPTAVYRRPPDEEEPDA